MFAIIYLENSIFTTRNLKTKIMESKLELELQKEAIKVYEETEITPEKLLIMYRIAKGFKVRKMLVTNDEYYWNHRIVFDYNPKLRYPFLSYNPLDDSKNENWKYAKELDEHKNIQEYSYQDLVKKIGHEFILK